MYMYPHTVPFISFTCRLYEMINKTLENIDEEEMPSGNRKMTRRMTIEEDDVVDFQYEWDDKGERVVLGRGSFGTVYSAIDLVTKRKMAVKEIQEKTAG